MHDTQNSKPVDAVPDSSGDPGAVSVAKFTPGPWKVGTDGTAIVIECVIDGEEFVVADIPDEEGSLGAPLSDAHLISAAPEMYAALQGLLGVVNSIEQAVYSNGEVYAAERALAKAEGRA